MVLAAGFGKRMLPLTEKMPKPMVQVDGVSLIDRVLDRLHDASVARAVVNVHYLGDVVMRHLASRASPKIKISDERDAILDTGGGIVRALPLLGGAPFFLVNSDTIWIEGAAPNLPRLAAAFDESKMDALLLLAPVAGAVGYGGPGDFSMSPEGLLAKRGEREVAPFVYAGAAILHPRLFRDAPRGAFSLLRSFERAESEGRLFGLRLDGIWMHVGTPEAIRDAEDAIRKRGE
ncbi:MAG: nucleotidyltransferase family protein [Xanthobacteraceae bacterium]|nr:nucleotidyltransferase family protein [Xanthobacteraceae bacterium]MCW5673309.1 nucleotidyltransferase family protein [Xanthobacteraceae bacterium]